MCQVSRGVCLVFSCGIGLWAPLLYGHADCNRNRVADSEEIASGSSDDCNGNRVPDVCDVAAPLLGLASAPAATGTPQVVASSDWNGDGRADLLLADRHSDGADTVSLRWAESGPSRYGESIPLLELTSPNDLHVADLDGDDNPDILAAGSRGLLLLRHLGGADFANPITLDGSSAVARIATADLDGDGWVDVLYSQPEADRIVLRAGRGDGTFAPATGVNLPSEPVHLAVSDLDTDGELEVAVTGLSPARVTILRRSPDGGYQTGASILLPSAPTSLQIHDANGDRIPDLFIATRDGVFVGTGDGKGDFLRLQSLAGNNRGAHAEDLDGDGDPDVALLLGSPPELRVLVNTGSGEFFPAVRLAAELAAEALSVKDLDANGTPDVIITGPGLLSIFWNGRNDTYGFSRDTLEATRRPHGGSLADLDGDGLPDAVLSTGHNRSVNVHFSLGDGTLGPEQKYVRDQAGHLNSVTTADVDSDGSIDVITADKELNHFSVFHNNGDGTLSEPRHYAAGRGAFHLTSADLDADGHVDLVSANEDGADITLSFNRGDGSFGEERNVRVGTRPIFVSAADLDQDGHVDLAVCNDTSQSLSVLFGDRDTEFRRSDEHPVIKQCLAARPVDLDRDGDLDLVTANGTEDVVGVFRNDGHGRLDQTRVPSPRPPQDVVTRDINNDGELDFIVLHKANSSISVLLGLGDGRFGHGTRFPVGELPRVLLAGDLELDGDIDVIVANRISQDVTVFENERAAPLSRRALPRICTERDLQLLSLDGEGSGSPLEIHFVLPIEPSVEFNGPTFPNRAIVSSPEEYLLDRLPVEFAEFTPPAVRELQSFRSTRSFYLGSIFRLPRLDSESRPLYGFEVILEDSPEELLGLEEIRAIYSTLSAQFLVAQLAYVPAGILERQAAAAWEAADFPIHFPDLPSSPAAFQRGDANADGSINIADASAILRFLFSSVDDPGCFKSADVDDSGDVLITDPVALLTFLFLSGTPPAAPFGACGQDATPDALPCTEHAPCQES